MASFFNCHAADSCHFGGLEMEWRPCVYFAMSPHTEESQEGTLPDLDDQPKTGQDSGTAN